jgi:hypothetical protein
MKVDSNPTLFESPYSSAIMADIHAEHLNRPKLLAKLTYLAAQYRFVRLSSPPSSGKSSLLKLYQHSLKNTKVIWISCLTSISCFDLFLAEGIDLINRSCKSSFRMLETVIFLDDAQEKFMEIGFWEQLINVSPYWLPSNISFIISSTYFPFEDSSSLLSFRNIPKLEKIDFQLSLYESNEFLELPVIGLPEKMKTETVKHVLVRECGGLIGALRQSIDSLNDRFAKDIQPLEAAVLNYYFSVGLLNNMGRCYGSNHSTPFGNDFKEYLKRIWVNEKLIQNGFSDERDNDSFLRLKKNGIIGETTSGYFGFSSPLAKRYYFKCIFPNRTLTAASTFKEVIENVVSNISATILNDSSIKGDIRNEEPFHHFLMEGLRSNTFPTNISNPKIIAGEIDKSRTENFPMFFENGDYSVANCLFGEDTTAFKISFTD